jgi:hypothetical protein
MRAIGDVLDKRPLSPGETAAVDEAMDAARQWAQLSGDDARRFVASTRDVIRAKQCLLTTFAVMGTADADLWNAFLDARIEWTQYEPARPKTFMTRHGRFSLEDLHEAQGKVGPVDAEGYTCLSWPLTTPAVGQPIFQRPPEAPRHQVEMTEPQEPAWWEAMDSEPAPWEVAS